MTSVINNSSRGRASTNGGADDTSQTVGILAMEVYTPRTYVKQSALEEHSGVPAGKYTLGLGQEALGMTGDAEDVNSLCLTVVHSLLEKYVDSKQILIHYMLGFSSFLF